MGEAPRTVSEIRGTGKKKARVLRRKRVAAPVLGEAEENRKAAEAGSAVACALPPLGK
jgi:hypothetical protein